jgi:hypothetical protein
MEIGNKFKHGKTVYKIEHIFEDSEVGMIYVCSYYKTGKITRSFAIFRMAAGKMVPMS